MQIEKKYGNRPINAVLLFTLPLVLAFAGLLPSKPVAAQQAITPENHSHGDSGRGNEAGR